MKKNLSKLLISAFLVCSCDSNTPYIPKTNLDTNNINVREMYTNKFDEEKISSQWEAYGIGDPFVYRWNGKYYLYASTKNNQKGVRCWESEDLLNFKPVDNKVLDVGYCSNEDCTVTAYAPEVMYYNGYFYMCESQGGTGHYILRSEKPEGPFVRITGNFGESIDGSFFIDDDEQIYFLRASTSGIRMAKIDETNNYCIVDGQKKLDNTELGGWTEGPYLLKRNGIYYLTYTGNSVVSNGYRVGYSYHVESDNESIFSRSAFSQADTILLNTSDEFHGLGHSSTVLGPNMDAYYIAYHNLNSTGGPNRSFNLSRLFFSGTDMYASNSNLYNNIKAEMPAFYTYNDEFDKVNSFNLSSLSTSNTYTVEYNFVGNVKCVFAYNDEANYSYAIVTNNNEVALYNVKAGSEEKVSSTKLVKSYDYSKLHTLRVAYKDNKCDVYFDNMCKINDLSYSFNSGKIGYLNASLEDIYYTAFSNYAFGSSDYEEVKQGQSLATNFSRTYSTINDSNIVKEEANEEDEFNRKEGSYDVILNKKGDIATYPYYFEEDGFYGFNLIMDKKYCGKTIYVLIDNTPYKVKVPTITKVNGQYVKIFLSEIDVTKGAHYVSFAYESEPFAFHSFETFLSSKVNPVYENTLEKYIENGAVYVNNWKLKDGGHYALPGNRQCLYLGKNTLTNYTIECDVKLIGDTSANTAGFIIRGANPAFASSESYTSIQGYYVSFNNSKFTISKCNYNNSVLDVSATALKIPSEQFHHIKIVVLNNCITATIDNETTITFVDTIGFTHGYFGLYTNGAASVYKNIKIY